VGGPGFVVVGGESGLRGEGASSLQVRAAWTLNGTEGAGETAKCVAGGLPDGGGRWYRRLCEK
jgi:hypothetical protein